MLNCIDQHRFVAQTNGPSRKVGKRLPGLKALVNNPHTPWQTVEMKDWYGR